MNASKHSTRRPRFESLENRQMMAVAAAALQSNGLLVIQGTNGSDVILVREQGSQITVEGWRTPFDAARVKVVAVVAGAGNDAVLNATSKPSIVWAGAGDDFVVGGTAADIVFGEDGNGYI